MSQTHAFSNRSRSSALFSLAAICVLGGSDAPSDPTFTALRVDGTTVSGRLRRLDVRSGVSLAVDEVEHIERVSTVALVKLTRDGETPSIPHDGGLVLFPDGDRLYQRADFGPVGDANLEVQSYAGGSVSIPLDGILGLIFAAPTDGDSGEALITKVRDEPRTGEVLWLGNGDRLTGGLLGLDEKTVEFQTSTGKVKVDRSGILALGFDPKLVSYPRPDGPYLELTLLDGSRLGATSVAIEGGRIQAMTRHGRSIAFAVGELAQIHTKNASVEYLADRAPAIEKYVAYVGPTRPVRRNLAVDGRPLRLAGKTYDRGLGTQSRSFLAYRLEPGAKRFQALVGIDDRAGPLGSAVFRVIVDGADRFVSPPLSVRDAPKAVDVDLKGARTLVLVTEFGERGEVRDHADWVEARLIR